LKKFPGQDEQGHDTCAYHVHHVNPVETEPRVFVLWRDDEPKKKSDEQGSSNDEKESDPLELETGLNEVRWNLRYPNAKTFPGMVLWGGGTQGQLPFPAPTPRT
jgi:hypothetical protein